MPLQEFMHEPPTRDVALPLLCFLLVRCPPSQALAPTLLFMRDQPGSIPCVTRALHTWKCRPTANSVASSTGCLRSESLRRPDTGNDTAVRAAVDVAPAPCLWVLSFTLTHRACVFEDIHSFFLSSVGQPRAAAVPVVGAVPPLLLRCHPRLATCSVVVCFPCLGA